MVKKPTYEELEQRVKDLEEEAAGRKHAEEALIETRLRYRDLIESAHDLIQSVRPDGSFAFVNPAWLETLGYGEEELPSLNLFDIIHPDSLQHCREAFSKTMSGQRVTGIQATFYAKDGREVYVEGSASPRFIEGEVIATHAIFRDLSERRLTQQALERRLSYEKMLGNISGRALLVDEIDEFLDSCLNIMGDKLDVSRIYIFEHHYETDTMDNTFEWAAPGTSPQKGELQGIPSSAVTWFMDMMKNNQIINCRDIEDIPGEQEKEILRPQKIKSILVVPLFIEREYYGFMGFDECRFHREWTDEDIDILRTIAQIITGTLERKWADEKEIRYVNDLASLSKGATALVELSPEEDLYHVIGKHLKELIGDSIVFVSSFDSASESFCVRQALGLGEHMETVLKLVGRHPVGMTIPISKEVKLGLTSGKLENVPGGLHDLSVGEVPTAICQAIEKLLGLGGAYAMGFAWAGELFGSASFLMRRGAELKNECIIETFVRQASVALQRRQAEEALRKAHYGLEELVKERTARLAKAVEQLKQEIKGHRRTEGELRESEEKYRLLAENVTDVIWISDMNFRLTYISPSITRMVGYSVEEAMSVILEDTYTSASLEVLERAFAEELAIEKTERKDPYRTRTLELEGICKDGSTIWTEAKMTFLRDQDGNPVGILGVSRDISDRKRMEEEKAKLEAQLQQAQKMEAIGTLAGGIAHDFNNLLMAIQGNASLILLKKDPSDPDYMRLKNIEQYIQNGSELTRQLLGFARGGKYEVRPIDLNELIKKDSEMFRRTKKEITIHPKYQKDIWAVEVDRAQIEQVLMNLYINAWQAMPGGGKLFLETENVDLGPDYVRPYGVEAGRYVKISIADTGVGMDKRTQERLFDPFFTTKEMGRGSGLGLASVYGIIKNHGGIINVHSRKGEGTTFNIFLPATEKEVIEEKELPETVRKGSEMILLVDDEEMIIDSGKEMLEEIGFEVLTAESGKEAIDAYRERKGQIEMVILDMIMPEMGGGETYDKLRELDPEIKVLLSSGYSIEGQAQEILDRGCNGFIQKPFNMKEISHKIGKVLHKE